MPDYSKNIKIFDRRRISIILSQFDIDTLDEFYFIDTINIHFYNSDKNDKHFVIFSIRTPKKIVDGKYSDEKYIVSAIFASDDNMVKTIRDHFLSSSYDIVAIDNIEDNIKIANGNLIFKDDKIIRKVFDKVRATDHYKKFRKSVKYIKTFIKKYNDKASLKILNDISILNNDIRDPHFLHYLLFEADLEDGGIKDLKEGDILVRILKLENEGSLKEKNNHWTDKPELLLDTEFLNSIDYNSTEVSTDGYGSFVLITTLNYNDLSLLDTIIARKKYVLESEVTLHGGSSNDIYVCRYKNFNENDPMNSKGIKKLN